MDGEAQPPPPPYPPEEQFVAAAPLDGAFPPPDAPWPQAGNPPAFPSQGNPMDMESPQMQAYHPHVKIMPKPLVIIPLCRKGDRASIEKQLQAGATVDETDAEGNTPLHVAVEAPKNEIATVQCLLEAGANANATNYIGACPLHYVCLRKSNQRGVANILLEQGANINAQTVAGKTALHFAAENQLAELTEVLCLFGADPNILDSEGCQPLHLALSKEGGRDTVRRQIVEHLVRYQSRVDCPNSQTMTPMHLAARTGSTRCVQFLLATEADVQVLTAKHQSCLHLACLGGHAEVTQLLLQVHPGSVDLVDLDGNTSLHICAKVGNLDCATLLLKAEANTLVKNNEKKTAFDIAKIKGADLNNTHNAELEQVLKDAKKNSSCRQS